MRAFRRSHYLSKYCLSRRKLRRSEDIHHWAKKAEHKRLLLEKTQLFLKLHWLTVGKESGPTATNISCLPTHKDGTNTTS